MTEDDLRALVRRVIADLASPGTPDSPAEPASSTPRRALVLFTGGLIGFDQAIENLRELLAAGVQLDYIKTPSAHKIIDQKVLASVGMRHLGSDPITDHDILILPTMTANTAAKIAHGIADDLASNIAMQFLMTNRPVVASRSPVCPDNPESKKWYPQMPAGYAELRRNNLRALDSFGVYVTDSAKLCQAALNAFADRKA